MSGNLRRTGPRPATWRLYLAGVALTGAGLLAAYIGGLMVLNRAGILPPPPIVNSLCADAKLEYLRQHPPDGPNLLIVGSSVAWRDIDSGVIARSEPDAVPLNAGFCAAQMNQTAFVARYFVARYASIGTVIAVLEPHDFRACGKTPAALFPPADTDSYVDRRAWLYGFYLRYFDAISLLHNVHRLMQGRQHEGIVFDRYGDSSTPQSDSRDLVYRRFEGYDRNCFDDLDTLAALLKSQGRHLILVSAPLNPLWTQRYDADGAIRNAFTAGLTHAEDAFGAVFWDADHDIHFKPDEFADAVHLYWPGATSFTTALVAATRPGGQRFARGRTDSSYP